MAELQEEKRKKEERIMGEKLSMRLTKLRSILQNGNHNNSVTLMINIINQNYQCQRLNQK